jgi:EmrB/QacA subfamily drug resistance transporter
VTWTSARARERATGSAFGRGRHRVVPAQRAERARSRGQVLGLCSLAATIAFLDVTIVNVAFPAIQASFPQNAAWTLSWVMSGYSITFAALLVPSGRLADRLGHRRAFLFGMSLFTLSSLGCALSQGVWMLIVCRLLQAIGAVAMVPAQSALLLGEYPPERRMEVSGLLGAVAATAAALGPTIGALLVHAAGWRAVFLVNVPLGVATLGWAVLILRRDAADPDETTPDLVGAGCLAIGLGALVLAVVEGNTWGWSSSAVLSCAGLAAALILVALLRSRRHPAPVVDFTLLRVPAVALSNVALALFSAAIYAKIFVGVLYLTHVWRWNVVYVGLAMLPGPLITALCAVFTTSLAVRIGVKVPVAVGLMLYATGCVWFAVVPGHTPSYLYAWMPGSVFTGVGNGLVLPVLGGASVASLPPHQFGIGSAVSTSARQLGSALGVALVVAVIGRQTDVLGRISLQHGFWFSAVTAVVAIPVVLAMRRGGTPGPVAEPAPRKLRVDPAGGSHAVPPTRATVHYGHARPGGYADRPEAAGRPGAARPAPQPDRVPLGDRRRALGPASAPAGAFHDADLRVQPAPDLRGGPPGYR